MSKEIVVYAFARLPVKITWLTDDGQILKRQTVEYEAEPKAEAARKDTT